MPHVKFLLPPSLLGALLLLVSFIEGSPQPAPASPLGMYSPAWNETKYLACNTAANTRYMSADEKEVIYILNMVRMDPSLFANTVVKQYPAKTGQEQLVNTSYYKTLLETLGALKPLKLITPDSLCFASAYCHALSTGKAGTVTHNRSTDECINKLYFNGECCDYGHNKALDILMALLIDQGVPSLGHREICLSAYKTMAVSIQPHMVYRYTAVLDFEY